MIKNTRIKINKYWLKCAGFKNKTKIKPVPWKSFKFSEINHLTKFGCVCLHMHRSLDHLTFVVLNLKKSENNLFDWLMQTTI